MAREITALKKRIVPALPITIEVKDEGGQPYKLEFHLSYDFNAAAALQEKTVSKQYPMGIKLPELSAWSHVTEPIFISALFWAGIIVRHPEYNSDEGLEVIRSYMDENNKDVITKACWDAYLLNVTKEKREFMQQIERKAEAEIKAKAGLKPADPPSPAAIEPTPAESNLTGSTSGPSPDTTSDLAKTNSAS
jgi:hypothetical protein